MNYAAMMQGSERERASDADPYVMAERRKARMGKRVDRHCPYDETVLRADKLYPTKHICPSCWTTFDKPDPA